MQLKSVSVENLGNVLKRMFNATLEDSSQRMKLDQAIYEEWYFEKMTQLRNTNSEKRYKRNEDAREKIGQEISLCSSSDLARNALSRDNSTNQIERLQRNPSDIKVDRDERNDGDTAVTCNETIKTNVGDDRTEEICESSKDTEQRVVSDSATPSLEIIQVWNKPAQTAKIRKKLKNNTAEDQAREQSNGELAKQVKRKISFETWKKKKSLIYRKLLREAEEKRQQELQQKMQKTERKKASQEAYAQILREKEAQQRKKVSIKRLQMIHQMDILQREIEERRVINAQAFDAWKKRKDMKPRGAKLAITNASYNQVKRSADLTSMILTERLNANFYLWLNRLNSVLHEKYSRERRHLVRSFYCQPTYYGAT